MDDRDEEWLTSFNAKAQGGSGENGEVKTENGTSGPPSAGRPSRNKGKDKDRESSVPAPLFISEDLFEFIMGVLEKHTEDSVPMLHTVCTYLHLAYTTLMPEP